MKVVSVCAAACSGAATAAPSTISSAANRPRHLRIFRESTPLHANVNPRARIGSGPVVSYFGCIYGCVFGSHTESVSHWFLELVSGAVFWSFFWRNSACDGGPFCCFFYALMRSITIFIKRMRLIILFSPVKYLSHLSSSFLSCQWSLRRGFYCCFHPDSLECGNKIPQ